MLRPYQQAAHEAAISWIKRSVDPAVIEAETGSGKSHIIAAVAKTFHEMSGKHVLCTAPSVELVQQNTDKYHLTGNKASIFSASVGKSLRHPVVFGTPMSIANSIAKFGDKFGLICIDECHGITPTIRKIIEELRSKNEMLRVIGLSATPYRLNTGYIYAMDENDNPCSPDQCIEPYFTKKIFTIGGRELIEQGYLTQPIIGAIHGDHYDTLNMQLNSMGKFNASDIDKAYHGQGRKTSRIIADIVEQARNRNGVMIFAATIQHAYECLESLPAELSAIVTSDTPKEERKSILKRFKSGFLKYLVNVSVLTTGFDAPHVDLIAILRATESVGLLKQIVGRGLRIYPDKKDCLILDYAENIERHSPDGDIFNPIIEAVKPSGGGVVTAICELCTTENKFSPRPNEDGFASDQFGYFVDLEGNRISGDYGFMPSHFGRRCMGLHRQQNGKHERCTYYWTFKECENCKEKNDIAARYCSSCKAEIVNPNDKLIADFKERKRDPYQVQCDAVLAWEQTKTLSKAGNEVLKVDYTTKYRAFSIWYHVRSEKGYFANQYEKFLTHTNGGDTMPLSITYKKNSKTQFYDVLAYNQEVDGLNLK